MTDQHEHIYTLTELNLDIRSAIETNLPSEYWVSAEISECHPNRNGHCYLELIDKDRQGRTSARQRAIIWSNTYKKVKVVRRLLKSGLRCIEIYILDK